MRRHFRAVIKERQAWSVDVKCCLILARTCDDVYLRNQSGEAAAQPGWTWVMLFISIFFLHFLLVFRSLIILGSQNKDDPTAYKIHHDIRQNQRSELLTFLSILKTSLLIYLLALYSILKNDIHTGKWGQGIWLQRSEHVLGLWILCLWLIR